MTKPDTTAARATPPEIEAARLFTLQPNEERTRYALHEVLCGPKWIEASDGRRALRVLRPESIPEAPVSGKFPPVSTVLESYLVKAPRRLTLAVFAAEFTTIVPVRERRAPCEARGCRLGKVWHECNSCGHESERDCPACDGTGQHAMKRETGPNRREVIRVGLSVDGRLLGRGSDTVGGVTALNGYHIALDGHYLWSAIRACQILHVEEVAIHVGKPTDGVVIEWKSGAVAIMPVTP